MYAVPISSMLSPFMPETIRNYIVCGGAVAILLAKITMQVMHPKRNTAHQALIQDQVGKLEAEGKQQAQVASSSTAAGKFGAKRGNAGQPKRNMYEAIQQLKSTPMTRKLF